MKVNICGITHEVIECEDTFDIDTHFGMITYKDAVIKINKDMPVDMKKEAICHEILHGMLVHLGYDEYSQDERFVQALANAINQTFIIKEERDERK